VAATVTGTYAEQFGQAFQRHILAVAAREPTFIIRFRSALDPSYFFSDLHRLIAKALFAHVDEYRSLPTIATLLEAAKETTPTPDPDTAAQAEKIVHKLFDADISDLQAVQDKAVEFGKTQAMCNAVIEAADQIERGKRSTVRSLIHDADLVGEDILDVGLTYGEFDRAALYGDDDDDLAKIPTGLPHLNHVMGGGLGRGELGVVLAPAKRGKSTCLINIAYGGLTVPQGFNVVHYTCEMGGKKVWKKYDDRLAGAAHKLKFTDPAAYAAALDARQKQFIKGGLIIKQYHTRKLKPSMIRSHLSVLIGNGFVPDVVIADYADIMCAERRLDSQWDAQAGVYEDLREIAGGFNVAMWTASQANRAAWEKASPDMQDFAGAFEKAAIVDAAISFGQTKEEKRDNKCRLCVVGLRDNEDGSTIECVIDRPRCFIQTCTLFNHSDVQIETPFDVELTYKQGVDDGLVSRVHKAGAAKKALLANGSKLPRRTYKTPSATGKSPKRGKGPSKYKGPRRIIAEND